MLRIEYNDGLGNDLEPIQADSVEEAHKTAGWLHRSGYYGITISWEPVEIRCYDCDGFLYSIPAADVSKIAQITGGARMELIKRTCARCYFEKKRAEE